MTHLQVLGGAIGLAMILGTLQDAVSGQQGQANQPPPSARAAAPYDPTGTWVSVITNNWRTRMVPPPLGDYADIPLNNAGRQLADAWDPAKDEAAKNECKYYGAASIMFQPTRLRVTWQNDSTLRVETDAGTQTRLFRFADATPAATTPVAASAGNRSWQGHSVAAWESRRPAARGGGGGAANPAARYLKVTTTNMLPGYLRKNGVPYGERAVLTEYYDVFRERDGTTMMIVTIAVDDSEYLNQQYVVIAHFKKEADASKWDPSPCSARW